MVTQEPSKKTFALVNPAKIFHGLRYKLVPYLDVAKKKSAEKFPRSFVKPRGKTED
jgi:hypothetical protein